MAEFAYNNAKNARIGNTAFVSNCKYYLGMFYKKTLTLDLSSSLQINLQTSFDNLC